MLAQSASAFHAVQRCISLPSVGFKNAFSTIKFSEIQHISEMSLSGNHVLNVTAGGRRFTILASHLPDASSYAVIKNALISGGKS